MADPEPAQAVHQREYLFEACFNVRDLGGYEGTDGRRTRWGTLYRGDGLHRLTDRDLVAIRPLGLKTVLDLRTIAEVDSSGKFRVEHHPVRYAHFPLVDELTTPDRPGDAPAPADRGRRYAGLVELGGESIAASVELLSRAESHPAVFHCSAGRDRTGILAAIILSLLGVGDDVIVADYVLTQKATVASDRWAHANDPDLVALWSRHPEDLRNTRAETMTSFLSTVKARYGSVFAMMAQYGVTEATVADLADSLLEPDGGSE